MPGPRRGPGAGGGGAACSGARGPRGGREPGCTQRPRVQAATRDLQGARGPGAEVRAGPRFHRSALHRAHPAPRPGPRSLGAGGGARRGHGVPAGGGRAFLPGWRAPRGREGKYRAFRPAEGGAVWSAPSGEGGEPGKSLGACQEHSAHNNLAENTAASASRNPGLAQSPAARASLAPRIVLTLGFFPLPSGSCTWPSSMKRGR